MISGNLSFLLLHATTLMRPYNRLHFFRSLRACPSVVAGRGLILCCAFVLPSVTPLPAAAQITSNKFVGAKVSAGDGFLTIYKGDPANNEQLSFFDESFLTVNIDGQFYSNNPF